MMDFTPTPESVAARYQKGVSFNNGIDLYGNIPKAGEKPQERRTLAAP